MKKKFSLSKTLGLAAVVLAVIALLLPLAPAYSSSATLPLVGTIVTTCGSAYSFIFGGVLSTTISGGNNSGTTTNNLEGPAPLALVAFVLLVLGVLVVAFGTFLACGKKKMSGIVILVGALLLVVAGILFFSVLNNLPVAIDKDITAESAAKVMEGAKLGFGFIGTGVVVLLSGIVAAVGGLINVLLKK